MKRTKTALKNVFCAAPTAIPIGNYVYIGTTQWPITDAQGKPFPIFMENSSFFSLNKNFVTAFKYGNNSAIYLKAIKIKMNSGAMKIVKSETYSDTGVVIPQPMGKALLKPGFFNASTVNTALVTLLMTALTGTNVNECIKTIRGQLNALPNEITSKVCHAEDLLLPLVIRTITDLRKRTISKAAFSYDIAMITAKKQLLYDKVIFAAFKTYLNTAKINHYQSLSDDDEPDVEPDDTEPVPAT